MIASSRPVFVGSVLCALTLHLAGMAFALKPETTQIAASGAAVLTKQGNAFTDLATGVISGVTATNQAASTPPATSTTAAVPQATEPVQSNATNASAATAKVQAGATAVIPSTTAVTPSTTTARPVTTATAAISPTQPIAPTPAKPIAQASPPAIATETITATALDPSVVLTSQRPSRRPEGLAPPPPPPPPQPTARSEPAPAPRGNAQQNANAGSTSNNVPQATATTSGSNAQNAAPSATAANSAAATNYPGQVMRRISRVRKPRTNARGAVTVLFSIAPNGSLAAVSVGQSSGNTQLDQMAVQVVQRAVPFPAPPSGAQTRFNVKITGR